MLEISSQESEITTLDKIPTLLEAKIGLSKVDYDDDEISNS